MSSRTFNYDAVSSVYNEIKKITTGDDSIKTILDNINRDCHNMVDVENEAVYGELGKQLLLDWDNTSSNFPNFIDNFNNWSALIAQASGNYGKFEEEISGFKDNHMLGATSEAGRNTAYTNTSFYHTYNQENAQQYEIDYNDLNSLHNITGVNYVCTDSEALLKRHKIAARIMLVGDVVSLWSFFSVVGGSAAGSATPKLPGPTQPALPGPTGAPALPGTVAKPIGDLADQLVLTGGVDQTFKTSLLGALNQAEQAGATLAQPGTNCLLEFLDSSGNIIGMLTENGFALV